MKLIAVKLDEQLMEMVNEAARRQDISRSRLIREALEHYLLDVLKMDHRIDKADACSLKIIC
jgi:metal-responsive CopG/Arc/MetJ family transcriptional regulator